jgi:hypothetical protein
MEVFMANNQNNQRNQNRPGNQRQDNKGFDMDNDQQRSKGNRADNDNMDDNYIESEEGRGTTRKGGQSKGQGIGEQ